MTDERRISIITTGGTIEKTYDEHDGSLSNHGSILKVMLNKLRTPHLRIDQCNLEAMDSLHMADGDRRRILQEIRTRLAAGDPVVVLHGTDTMETTAQLAYDEFPHPDAPVVFTGAMKPYGFEDSDALQNLTEALLAAGSLDPGVYIVLHSTVLPLPGVRKNRETLTFEKLDETNGACK